MTNSANRVTILPNGADNTGIGNGDSLVDFVSVSVTAGVIFIFNRKISTAKD